jgi:hypothetical protein
MKSMGDYSFESVAKRNVKIFSGCLAAIIVLFIVFFLGAAIGMWLWNAILVPMFAFPVIGYWQMYGIMILGKLIFGGYSTSSSSK